MMVSDLLQESLDIARDHIFSNPYVMSAAKAIKLEPYQRVQVFAPIIGGKMVQQLEFFVLENDLSDWKERHQKLIGVDFARKNEYVLKARHKVEVGGNCDVSISSAIVRGRRSQHRQILILRCRVNQARSVGKFKP